MGNWFKYLKLLAIGVLLFFTFAMFSQWTGDGKKPPTDATTELSAKPNSPAKSQTNQLTKQSDYAAFVKDYQSPDTKITGVKIESNGKIVTTMKDGATPYVVYLPSIGDDNLVSDLLAHNISVNTEAPKEDSGISFMGIVWLLVGAAIIYQVFSSRKMGGAGGADKFSKSKAEKHMPGKIKTRFSDIAGVEIASVQQVLDFLAHPEENGYLGAKIPHGILLIGPPGCGKTLYARAIAGEANCAFFSMTGSDFVEMFVGVGAARIRSTFKEARDLNAPVIIFIDELDAIGRSRSSGHGGQTNDERENTLNQLLTEMDGFSESPIPVIVLAATNRPDILDKALLRTGRFDRKITIPSPDAKAREEILAVHAKGKIFSPKVNMRDIAVEYVGATGSDLANLLNESATRAEMRKGKMITVRDVHEAKDEILMGKPRRGDFMSPKEKRNTAYHEAGHAIVGELSPGHDKVYKVSIIPREKALGVTVFLPERERISLNFEEAESMVAGLYGGHAAEEILNGERGVTTGASNDYERATNLVTAMITQYSFYAKRLGGLIFATTFGDELATGLRKMDYSEQTAQLIDNIKKEESDRIYAMTMNILRENWSKMEVMAEALLKWGTIDKLQVKEIMQGKTLDELPEPVWVTDSDAAQREESEVVSGGKQE